MTPSPLLFLLIPTVATTCMADAQSPESIRDMETAYHQFCTKRGAELVPSFSKKLLALQKQAVDKSDFEEAKQIQTLLTNLKKDILAPPSSNSVDPFFTGKVWGKGGPNNGMQYVDSSLRRFEKKANQTEFQPQNQWVDPNQSSREIVVFTPNPSRIWLKKDGSTVIQIYQNSSVDWFTIQGHERNAVKSSGSDLNNLQQEFRIEYAKACKSLTKKYLAAVGKKQKQLVQEGKMEEAIAIHEYMKQFSSRGKQADQIFKGIWKNQHGILYDFSDKSKVAVKKPDGTLMFFLICTSISPKGEWKTMRPDRGWKDMEVYLFPAGEKLYTINNKTTFISVLTRVPGN